VGTGGVVAGESEARGMGFGEGGRFRGRRGGADRRYLRTGSTRFRRAPAARLGEGALDPDPPPSHRSHARDLRAFPRPDAGRLPRCGRDPTQRECGERRGGAGGVTRRWAASGREIVIVGARGHAKDLIGYLEADGGYRILCLMDEIGASEVLGYEVLSPDGADPPCRDAFLAIGMPRAKVAVLA